MFCGNCGKQVKDGADFCPACGAKMKSKTEGKAVAAAQSTQVMPPVQGNQASQVKASAGASGVNKGLIIGLSIGIGVLALAVILVVVFLFFGDQIFPKESTKVEVKTEQSDSAKSNNNDYIIADSNSRYLTESELNSMSTYDLYLARNEIFARHGRDFKKQELKDYFGAKSWYHVQYSPSEFDAHTSTLLNDFERKNSELMLKIEKLRNSPYLAP